MKIITLFYLLFGLFNFSYAKQGFPPITDIQPNHPTVEQEVLIGYDFLQYPCLIGYPNFQGLTEYIEIDSNNHIEITVSGLGTNPCLNIGVENPPYEYYSLGMLPIGDYTIQMYWTDTSTPLPVPPNLNRASLGEVISFSVGAPVAVPALKIWSLFLLIIGFLILTALVIENNTKRLSIMLFLVLFSGFGYSKTYHIMLSVGNGAPSAEDVINQLATSPSPPAWLLNSFNQIEPSNVEYLIEERPVGNLLNLVDNAPDWALSKLFRFLVVTYPDTIDEQTILTNFQNDQYIKKSGVAEPIFFDPPTTTSNSKKKLKRKNGIGSNYLTDLNIISAWELSEGMGYIGAIDLGLQINHPDLQAFNTQTGNYLGGNLLEGVYQIDFGQSDLNVDEQEPFDTLGQSFYEPCDLQDGDDDNLATSIFVGHGTHITGILTGKNNNIGGICKNCGMSMMKHSDYRYENRNFCINYNGVYTLSPVIEIRKSIKSMKALTNLGVGVVSWSGGYPAQNEDFCSDDDTGLCYALELMLIQNTLMVGAAGNSRTVLQFPASEVGTVAVGGLDENGGYWNESPTVGNPYDNIDKTNCPRSGGGECGSNYSHEEIGQNIDVMAQARTVYSTFYEGGEWADDLNCTDFQDGSVDGYGNCTGTSMSAPQVAAILQLMRSTNPLLPNGTYDPSLTIGLINILNASSSRSTSGLGHNKYFGYGLPDARLALEMILGKSNSIQMKTRLTPMFALASNGDNNDVYTPFPQVAKAFLINNGSEYLPDTNSSLVNEFSEFWYDTNSHSFPAPRANFYVFTTNNNPFTGTKNMTPLRRMEKTDNGNRNDTYAISNDEIEQFHADGYNYAGIEGYILPACSPVSSCTPQGATRLYRDESDSMNHKLITVSGSINPAPANSVFLGFVYLNVDADSDGLINGQEIILGTDIFDTDSDDDTIPDGVEYPAAGVPYSDPMVSDIIFKYGFETN